MRTLPALVLTELAKEATFERHLFKLVAGSTYYWTDCDSKIYFDSHWWLESGIKFNDVTYGIDYGVASARLTIPNADKWFSNLSLSEELRNKSFMIYRVWLNNSLGVIGCSTEANLPIVLDGIVDRIPGGNRKEVHVEVVSYSITGNIMTPRRVFEPKCPWLTIGGFKGTYCAYAGAETWCDGSKTRCTALGNSLNFGGWEYISDLQSQDVNWGQRTKTWYFGGKPLGS